MKQIILFFVIVGAGVVAPRKSAAQAGNTDGPITARAYDAMFVLSKFGDTTVRNEVAKIDNGRVLKFISDPLSSIGPNQTTPSRAQLDTARLIAEGASAADLRTGKVTSSGGARGFSRESAFIYGLTDFVIARTKSELTAATFRQAQGWFKASPTLRTLFPATFVQVVNVTEPDPQSITLLRTSARQDFDVLPTTLWKIARDKCDTTCRQRPERTGAIDAIRAGAALAESFERRESPVVAFSGLGRVIADSDFFTRAGRLSTRIAGITAGEVAKGGATVSSIRSKT